MSGAAPRVLTVLRGAQLRPPGDSAAPPADPGTRASAATAAPSTETIYGVPASAVQHCCGRGCKHCRIHWHKFK